MKNFSIVVAATASTLGIGRNGALPWKLPGEVLFFKNVTAKVNEQLTGENVVIMGRKTWESIPVKYRPLKGRYNVVLSKNPNIREEMNIPSDVLVASSLSDAMEILCSEENMSRFADIFLIGGESIFREAIESELCSKIYLTLVETDVPCDVHLPTIPAHKFRMTYRSSPVIENGITYSFTTLEKISNYPFKESDSVLTKPNYFGLNGSGNDNIQNKENVIPENLDIKSVDNPEEQQYLNMIEEILATGIKRGDRTGTGTISKFGTQMKFKLSNNIFPLLTTKRVFWRGVVEELLWFIRGSTNAKELQDKGVHIWDGNGSKSFLTQRGLGHREENDLGPVYGFQWRHFGASYTDMHADYSGQGVDQLATCIEQIKTCRDRPEDSSGRRIILTAWDPSSLHLMALPPCHMFCQFYVAEGRLSCHMYQRSADMGLGVPFNIASYALLTCMIAQVCQLQPGEFVHTIGDAHVYLNHVEALREQLTRKPKPFPKLFLNPAVMTIDGFRFEDFTLEGYDPLKAIKMEMAV